MSIALGLVALSTARSKSLAVSASANIRSGKASLNCVSTREIRSTRARLPRPRSFSKVLNEIGELVQRFHVKEIMDDTGTFPVGDWLKGFCQGMIERGYSKKIYFDCNMRFGSLDFSEYKLMKKAGFRLILFGLESANQKTLDRINKKDIKI